METLPETAALSREDRFAALTERVGEPLRRYAVRRTDAETAQDVLAETFLVLWRRLDDVPGDDPLPWCYAVARGCLSNARRASRRQLRLVDRLARQPAPGPARTGLDDAVHDALDRLPEADREVLRLWAWEELAPREIAVVLGVTANAVSIRLHRARKKLAEELGKDSSAGGQEPGVERRNR